MSVAHRHKKSPLRQGSTMAAMLLCLLAIMMFCASLTRSIVVHHRQLQRIEQRQQSLWLADCGMQRALYRWSQDAGYRGEIWKIPRQTLGGPDAGQITIRIEPVEGSDGRLTVFVESHYPAESPHRVTHLRERTIDSNPGELP